MTRRDVMRSVRLVAGLLVLGLAVAEPSARAGTTPAPVAPPTAAECTRLLGSANVWHQVDPPAPHGSSLDVEALDRDPCTMLATDAGGSRWFSPDGGRRWVTLPDNAPVTRLAVERLQVRARDQWLGPVLGSGGDVPQVYASSDAGRSFTASALDTGNGDTTPFRGELVSAATGVHWADGVPHPYVYAVAKMAAGTVLTRSTDGGRTFRPTSPPPTVSIQPLQVPVLSGQQPPVPAVVAVSPVSQDEVWTGGRGAWVSYNAGESFTQMCCDDATVAVNDIAVGAAPDGSTVVVLATDKGIRRSFDDGDTWTTIADDAATGIRIAPDNPSVMVVQTADGVELSTGTEVRFRGRPGLPADCRPARLRRGETVPPTYLVDCQATGTTYRLRLTDYAAAAPGTGPPGQPQPPLPLPGTPGAPRPMPELATWHLPGWQSASSSIAFDGLRLYYDTSAGSIARIDARTGESLGVWDDATNAGSLTFDLRHDELLVSERDGTLHAIDVATHQRRVVGATPYKVPSYDAVAGLSWFNEHGVVLRRREIEGDGPGTNVCSGAVGDTSTYVAAGDGGGYVMDEDDQTVVRVDGHCDVLGTYRHRVFSESTAENDAMACDTQTFFPQPAIWIRDSEPGTVSAYAVPSGYCPMPSGLVLSAPAEVLQGTLVTVCTTLTNATTELPAAQRPITLTIAGAVVGHQTTDESGTACFPWSAPFGLSAALPLPVLATFSGDSALYPSSARGSVTVLPSLPAPPAQPRPPVVGAVPPPPAPVPAIPPNPVANVNPAAAPGQAPAPQPGQVPQAQAQSLTAPVAVPQRQEQPQLALARVTFDLDTGNAMVTAKARDSRSIPFSPGPTVALLGMSCVVTAALARGAAYAYAGSRRRPPRKRDISGYLW